MNNGTPVRKILVLSANPKGTQPLRLDEEIREIKQGLQLATRRDKFVIESAEAVRYRDIHRSILNFEPQIVHFSGHGAGEPGLVFEDNAGKQKLVDAEALAGLFELFADQVECVLLNACYSEIQAQAIAQHLDYVIGMSHEIGDQAAIEFAVGFYDALGAGRAVEFAYKLGCNAIRMAGIPEHLTPKLLKKTDFKESRNRESRNTIPTPEPPQDARKAPDVSPPSAPKTDFVPREEKTNITQYRQKVEEFAADGMISEIESHILNHLQKKLRLTDEQVSEIQAEVLEPYDIYRQQFTKKVAAEGHPPGKKAEAELKQLQDYYKIKDEYVTLLNQEAEKEAEKQVKQQETERLRQESERLKNLRQEAEKKQLIKTQPFEFETATLGKNHEILRSRREANLFKEDLGNGLMLEMVSIPGGSFTMGSPESEAQRSSSESPQHNVTIQPFFMGKFAVTQEQYQAVMGKNPSHFKGGKRPVESITWDQAVEFCADISNTTEKIYRLPSEAEWEYACRAGTTTPFYFGETITTDLANYDGNYAYGSAPKGQYQEQTTDVGSFPANAFGLYDMHGNVWEWCQDNWHENYEGAPSDGTPWSNGDNSYRILRGGSCLGSPNHCRCAFRLGYARVIGDYLFGFRVVCVCPMTP